jgi:Ni/Co efflux regulator RcnB
MKPLKVIVAALLTVSFLAAPFSAFATDTAASDTPANKARAALKSSRAGQAPDDFSKATAHFG